MPKNLILFLQKLKFFKFVINYIFEGFKNLSNIFNMNFVWVYGINKDIIWIHIDKNIKFFSQILINIALKTGKSIRFGK